MELQQTGIQDIIGILIQKMKVFHYITPMIFQENTGLKKEKIKYSNDEVYIANFVRALADLILLQDNISEFRFCSNDYLTNDEQKRDLYTLLLEVNERKDIQCFLKDEFPKSYYM